MSLCDRYEALPHTGPMDRPAPPELTPAARDAAQAAILARWLAMPPSWRNTRLDQERTRRGVPIPETPTHPLQRPRLVRAARRG
jgi:hypothetical protein